MKSLPGRFAGAVKDDPRLSGYRWLVLAVATLSQASAAFATQGLAVMAGFLQKDLRLSGAEVGLLFTASGIAPLFTLILIGDLLDRKSERLIIGIGTLIIALGLTGAVFAPSFPVLLLSLIVVGVGYSTVQPGGSRSVSKWFRPAQLGTAMGIRQAGLPAGGAAAAAVLPLVISTSGWRGALVVTAAIVLGGGFIFWSVYRAPEQNSGASRRPALSLAYLSSLLQQGWMRRVVWSGVALVGMQMGVVVYLMLFLRDRHSMPLQQGAWLLFLIQLCGGVGRILLSAWSDRCGRHGKRFFPVTFSMLAAMAGLGVLLLAPVHTPLPVLAVIIGWLGFFALGWYGPWVTYIAESAPADSVGLALGAAMTLNQLAIVITPPLLGLIYDSTGNYAYLWCFLIAWVGLAFAATRTPPMPAYEAAS